MAVDKAITELPVATTIEDEDLFVLEQNNAPKALPGQVLVQYLADHSPAIYVQGNTLIIDTNLINGNEVSY